MGKFAKWIAGGLGWAFLGPVGGILGFFVGSLLETDTKQIPRNSSGTTTVGDFAVSMLVLVSAVMKADGKVMKSELNYVQDYFRKKFGDEAASEASVILRDLLKQEIPVDDVCHQIRERTNYGTRLELLHVLFGICVADDEIHDNEIRLTEQIASQLGIKPNDTASIKAMFVQKDDPYAVLEVDRKASNEEIKKAYRTLVTMHHPDKVAHLGEDIKKDAEQKFKVINQAYNKIKKQRGIN